MKPIIPDLSADVIPSSSIAGIKIGMTFDDFLKYAPYQIVSEKEYNQLSKQDFEQLSETHGVWYVLERRGVNLFGKRYHAYTCRWNDDVILRFNGYPKKVLHSIIARKTYQGSLFGKYRVNDRLDKFQEEYDLVFYGDSHFIDYKGGKEGPKVEIITDYLADIETIPNQVIQGFLVMMSKTERERYGLSW